MEKLPSGNHGPNAENMTVGSANTKKKKVNLLGNYDHSPRQFEPDIGSLNQLIIRVVKR